MIWTPDDSAGGHYQVIAAVQRGSDLYVITEGPAAEQAPAPLTRVQVLVDGEPLAWLNANGHANRSMRLLLTTAVEAPKPDTTELRVLINVDDEPVLSQTPLRC